MPLNRKHCIVKTNKFGRIDKNLVNLNQRFFGTNQTILVNKKNLDRIEEESLLRYRDRLR